MTSWARIGRQLAGKVLEIGPGTRPFPTGPGARVVYADKSVPGGRDRNWPELAGLPRGPAAEYEVDLDTTGLQQVRSDSFDAVIASHLIEHLANPVLALQEMQRVVRPGGRMVLIVPERRTTFDAPRPATPMSHLIEEFRDGISEVSREHIEEFCAAIYAQPPMHPPEVRAWHDPARLDDDMLDLHRRRSIHVHCWSAEEFASLLVGLLALGLISIGLVDQLFGEDDGADQTEFGLVLEKLADTGPLAAMTFAERWVGGVLDQPNREKQRIVDFAAALTRDLCDQPLPERYDLAALPTALLKRRQGGAIRRPGG